MTRHARSLVLAVAGLAFAPSALAGEPHHSEPQDIQFKGIAQVINTSYELPFGTSLDLIIEEFWVGVKVTLSGNQAFGVQAEATSDVSWGGDAQDEGIVYQTITPIDGSGAAAMQSDVAFNITFDIWRGDYGTGSRIINFPLFAQGINFKVEAEPFTPFMLPGQDPSSETLNARSTDLAFDRTFGFPIGLGGVVSITPGVRLTGYPQAYAYFTGTDLQTEWIEGQAIISSGLDYPGEIALYEPVPSVDLSSAYNAFVQSSINYVFRADFVVTIDIIGIFSFPFKFNLLDYTVPLFTGTEDVAFESAEYTHPLPMFEPSSDKIGFGTVDVGATETFTYLFNNDGGLELTGFVGLEGDAAFTAAPNQLAASPGGQDSIVLTFSPPDAGEYEATRILETNDPYQPVHEIRVTGKGAAVETPIDDGNDNTDNTYQPDRTVYSTCGCSSSSSPSSSLIPLVGLLPLVALRRRRQA